MRQINSSFASEGYQSGLAGLNDRIPGERNLSYQKPMLRGTDVAFMQKVLGITSDGVFGPQTQAAVKQWQRSNGFNPTGVVTRDDWQKLRAASPSTSGSSGVWSIEEIKRFASKVGDTFKSKEAMENNEPAYNALPDWLWLNDEQYDAKKAYETKEKSGMTTAQLVKYTAIGAVGVSLLGVTLAAMGDNK